MRRIFAGVWVAVVVAQVAVRAETITFGGPTMGTTYHVRLADVPASFDRVVLQKEVEVLLHEVDRQMSTYRRDSELSRFNRATGGEWFRVSPAIVDVVKTAQAIAEKTDGALDVTVGPLVRLWHFGPAMEQRTSHARSVEPPADDAIAATKKLVGYKQLEVARDSPALRKRFDGLEVDLSSIAPGYAIDRIAALLVDRKLKNFMVEIGGEIRAAGLRDDGQPWRVAVERPIAERREMKFALPLSDASIATAGDYRKFFEYGGRRYSHIIDPSTGRPVSHALASVTVVADTCMEADGWDTPLLVLGPDRGLECAEKHGIAALFIGTEQSGGEVRETAAWRERFRE